MFRKNGVNRPAQITDTFPMNDTYLENTSLLACGQIIQHHILYIARPERVQIQHAVYRQLQRFIHSRALYIEM
jgi:hypothetical protein